MKKDTKISKNKLNFFLEETQICELCGSQDMEKLNISDREGFGVGYVRCNSCTLVFANRYMTSASLNNFYRDHYAKFYPSHNLSDAKRNNLVNTLRKVSSFFSNDKSILDYGCGDGKVLDELSADYSIRYGLDYIDSSILTEKGSKIVSHLSMVNLPINFDVILMSQVVEHMANPLEVVRDVCLKLKIGGVLIVEVPGLYSLPSIKSKKAFLNQFKLCHKTYFTDKTLTLLLMMAGLKVVYSDNSTRAIAIKLNQDSATKPLKYSEQNTFSFFSREPELKAMLKKYAYKVRITIKALWFKTLFRLLPKSWLRKILLDL